MSNDLIKAADDARRLLRGFKAFAEVADALEAVGQLELRAKEAANILAGLQVQVAAAQTDVSIAKVEASEIVADAKSAAGKLVAKAEVKASEILGAAQTAAKDVEAKATDLVANRLAESVSAAAARDSALVKSDALVKECEALEARLAKAQASVAKLLG